MSARLQSDIEIATEASIDFLAMPTGIPDSWKSLTPRQAIELQRLLGQHQGWREQALTRGTSAAEANIYLAGKVGGSEVPIDSLSRLARGLAPAEKPPSAPGSQQEAAHLAATLAAVEAELDAL